jgi:hypothetical protein
MPRAAFGSTFAAYVPGLQVPRCHEDRGLRLHIARKRREHGVSDVRIV